MNNFWWAQEEALPEIEKVKIGDPVFLNLVNMIEYSSDQESCIWLEACDHENTHLAYGSSLSLSYMIDPILAFPRTV